MTDSADPRRGRSVPDPEMPVLTIDDLGILRDVRPMTRRAGAGRRSPPPTPAARRWTSSVRRSSTRCARRGLPEVEVQDRALARLDDRLDVSDRGAGASCASSASRRPGPPVLRRRRSAAPCPVRCPLCGSPDTRQISRFGSTACKALRAATPAGALRPLQGDLMTHATHAPRGGTRSSTRCRVAAVEPLTDDARRHHLRRPARARRRLPLRPGPARHDPARPRRQRGTP